MLQRIREKLFLGLMRLPPRVMELAVGRRAESEGHAVDLTTAFLLKVMALEGPTHRRSVAAQRREADTMGPMSGGPPRAVQVEDRRIEAPGRDLRVRIYRPLQRSSKLPMLVYFHGGGWVIGSIESHDRPARVFADEAPCVVVSVDYRLAPEHKFPAAIDDALFAFQWAADHADSMGADPTRVAVGGDSAGGTLATSVARLTKDGGGSRPMFQFLIYPATDLSKDSASVVELAEGFYLTRAQMHWFRDHYLRTVADRTDDRVSPVLASDLAGMPPAYVVIAGFDPLRDEGRAYAERLRAAGVDVTLVEYPGLIHAFINLAGVIPAAKGALAELSARLREGFARSRA